ncbi:hypothetical protein TIFTF001_035266 [Ficus carica]|uniref:Uncharacterized protein n=1 Tax=Ficus carica TaxID=3494 RepID=A0AA88J693_FICCA|nr:hypothetical protein TIFTF001_035266 [Ficus carica]
MKLFPFVGQPQPGTQLEEKRVVNSENGVVMERSWGGKRTEEEAGISEIARGGESGEGEELGEVVGVASFQNLAVELQSFGHGGYLLVGPSVSPSGRRHYQ